MRGNRRWYGSPVWALVMMAVLVISSYAPVVLAETGTPGVEPPEQEVPAPEVTILQTTESQGDSPPPDPGPGTGGALVAPATDPPAPVATDPPAPPPSEPDPENDVPPQVPPGDDMPVTEPAGEPDGDEPVNSEDLEPTEAPLDETEEPAMGLMALEDDEEPFDPANLVVSISGPATIQAGLTATFSMNVTNTGSQAASFNIRLDGTYLWAQYISSLQPTGCTGNNFGLSCDITDLPAGGTAVLPGTYRAPDRDSASCGESYSLGARIWSVVGVPPGAIPDGYNATHAVTLVCPDPPGTVVDATDLSISLSGPGTVFASGVLNYNLTVTNNGEVPVDEVAFEVRRPIGPGIAALNVGGVASSAVADWTCSNSTTTDHALISCRAFDLIPGGSLSIWLIGVASWQATPGACGSTTVLTPAITWADGMGQDAGGAGWIGSPVSTAVKCADPTVDATDLEVAMTHQPPSTAVLGDTITYRFMVRNAGDAPFSQLNWLFGPVGASASFNGDASILSQDGVGDVVCLESSFCWATDVAPGGQVVMEVSYELTGWFWESRCGTALEPYASVIQVDNVMHLDLPDPYDWYAFAKPTTIVCPSTDTAVSVSLVGPASLGPGGPTGYTFTVTNTGDDPLADVVAVLPLTWDSGATWTPTVMTSGASANCTYDDLANEVRCVIAEIPVGGSVAIAAGTNTAAMDDGYCATTLSQTAVVASINGDNNLGHGWGTSNVSETAVVCDGAQVDDITIALSGPAEVKRGDAFTYQMTITNTGDVVANEIRTTATLQNTGADWTGTLVAANPAIGDFPGAGGLCSFVGVSLACSIFGLQPGGSVTIEMSSLTGALDDTFCATTRNQQASIAAVDSQLPGASSNTVSTLLDCGADPENIGISLGGDELVYVGETVSYTMEVSNNGDETANEVRLTTSGLPSTGSDWTWTLGGGNQSRAVSTSDATGSCTYIPSLPPIVACTVLGIAPGESMAVTVQSNTEAADDAICANAWDQEASVVWVDGQVISNTWSNTVTTEFRCEPGLWIEKGGPWDLMPGDDISYEITVGARGGAVEDIVVIDSLPADWAVSGWYATTPEGVTCVIDEQEVAECVIDRIESGEWVVFWLVTDKTPDTIGLDDLGCEITNVASITQAEGVALDPAIVSNRVVTDACSEPEPETLVTVEKEGPAVIERGDALWYEITVTNISDDTVTFNLFDGELLETTGYDWSVASYTGFTYCEIYMGSGAPLMRCLDEELAPGETKAVRIESVGTDVAAEVCEITNRASVGRINDDPYSGENSNLVTTMVENCGEPPATPDTPGTETPPATPGTPVATPGTPVATPGTPVATPGTPVATPGTPVATPGTPVATPGTPVATPGTPTPTVPATPTQTVPATPTQTATSTATATVDPPASATVPVTPDGGDAGHGTIVAGLPGTGTTAGDAATTDNDDESVAGLPVTGQGATAGGSLLMPFLLMIAVLLAAAGHRMRASR